VFNKFNMIKSLKNLNIIAIIAARGGSKRIPKKNIALLGGIPLVAHTILQAKAAKFVRQVYVSTDDKNIAKVAEQYGASVIHRPKILASDKATVESALIHVLDSLNQAGQSDPDLVVLLQATSPLRKVHDIDGAIETLVKEKADSLFSACRDKGLMWLMKNKKLKSVNYNYHDRKREQDMGVQYRENGSIYVLKPEILRKYSNRLGGKIAVYEMDIFHSVQIDEPEDVIFVDALRNLNKHKN